MDSVIPVIAGAVSTSLFATSTVPMLWKAFRTRDLASYSFSNLVIANAGNAVHSVYVFNLPPGPIWFLHSFYLVTSGAMLMLYLRYGPALSRRHWDMNTVPQENSKNGNRNTTVQ